jgi:hypothetical protein
MRFLACIVFGAIATTMLASCSQECSIEGQYFVSGTVTSGNCSPINAALTITPAISGLGADYFVQIDGSFGGCPGKRVDVCSVDIDCTGTFSDAIDPNDNVGTVHMSLVMSSSGFSGTATMHAPATTTFKGCTGTQELGGTRD